ncbi:MAG: tripartite tricarboxylate transporter substrate-binding protein, partial [Pseudomonadota bacterium]|nr:tripartite tricarboxylate transporter substrate-binding protein [Pseudomonadota bacterium]
MSRPALRRAVLALALAVVAGAPLAQKSVRPQPATAGPEWPTRPLKIMVGFPGGSTPDLVARTIAEPLSRALGQPVIVENRPGAGSLIGTDAVAKSAPDGYTLLLMSNTHTVNESLFSNKSFDLMRDFVPIAPINYSDLVLVTRPGLGANSIADLLKMAKAKPGALTYATAGVAASSHVLGSFFNIAAGIDTVHVPYKGGGPGMLDLRAGRVHYMITSMVSSLNFARDGRARLLAVSGTKRSHLFPDVPTLGEAG